MSVQDRFRGCLIGLATGDAVGTTLEFKPRGSFTPIDDMVGGGPFQLAPGQWTDDTSMALCLAASLLEHGGHNPTDQLQRYIRWRDEGYQSVTGHCFDIGNTVSSALRRFEAHGDPNAGSTAPTSAGNGCTMRLAPVPMYFYATPEQVGDRCADSSRTTHGAPECLDACRWFGTLLWHVLHGTPLDLAFDACAQLPVQTPRVQGIARGLWRFKSEADLRGTGYVIDGLEAAVWCVAHTTSFRDAILKAANLGDDADTTAAVAGQLAGAVYGHSGIPEAWRAKLAWHDTLRDTADALHAAALTR